MSPSNVFNTVHDTTVRTAGCLFQSSGIKYSCDREETELMTSANALADEATKADEDGNEDVEATAAHSCAATTMEEAERRDLAGSSSD